MRSSAGANLGRCALSIALVGCFGEAPEGDGDGGTTTAPTSSGPASTTSATDPTATTSTNATTSTTDADATSADTTTTASTDPSTTENSSTTDTSADEPTFFDDFERADSQALGNNWVEKESSVFALVDGTVAAETNTPQQYYDQVVYQLDNEVADIELHVEFRLDAPADGNEPHLVARQQADALVSGEPNQCYILVPQPGQSRLCLMRFDAQPSIGEQQCTTWTDELVVGDWYRLVMTIEGPGPVEMTGRLEHDGADGWEEVVAVTWLDMSPNRIDTPGSWGFSGGTSGLFFTNYVFDNFAAYYDR